MLQGERIFYSFEIMESKTVSFRIPKNDYQDLVRMAEKMDASRSQMLRRFVIAGVQALRDYEESGDSFDWPRGGRISMYILPGDLPPSDELNSSLRPLLKRLSISVEDVKRFYSERRPAT